MNPARLEARFVEKLWGSQRLEPWFPDSGRKIGEVWFSTGEIPLLIKFLFTTEHLSVQVHPNDEYAREHENSRGKTEMWHILRADEGAKIGLGFERPVGLGEVERGSKSGGIMDLLRWIPVKPGQTYFVPAGVVHAIGGGVALCEIQQHSDVTYRLYDYNRGRGLQLEHGLKVVDLGCHPGISVPKPLAPGHEMLVDCDHFRTERIEVSGQWQDNHEGSHVLVILRGSGTIAGQEFAAGQAWRLSGRAEIQSQTAQLLRTSVPPNLKPGDDNRR